MSNWADICHVGEILPNMGRCALVDGEQVAIFRVKTIGQDIDDQFYAVNNYCPFSDANIISRGIVGCLSEQVVVASPLYKQHFDLVSGKCLEDETVSLKTYPVRIEGDKIQLAA